MDFNEVAGAAKAGVDLVVESVGLADKIWKLVKNANVNGTEMGAIEDYAAQLRDQLIRAQQGQLELQGALMELKQDMMEADRRLELERSYKPFKTEAGALVLAQGPQKDGLETTTYICPDCASQGRKSFLQPQGTGKRCNPCDVFFQFDSKDLFIGSAPNSSRWD